MHAFMSKKCSKFAYHAINRLGLYNGLMLTFKRIHSCNPSRYNEKLAWAPKKIT